MVVRVVRSPENVAFEQKSAKMKQNPVITCNCLWGGCRDDRAIFSLLASDDIPRGSGHKWLLGRFRLDIRETSSSGGSCSLP